VHEGTNGAMSHTSEGNESFKTVRSANVSFAERDEQGFLVDSPMASRSIERQRAARRDQNVSQCPRRGQFGHGRVSGERDDDVNFDQSVNLQGILQDSAPTIWVLCQEVT
jgi:hypothetical protein